MIRLNRVYTYEQSHDDRGGAFSVVRLNSWEYARMIYCNWHREIEFVFVRKGTLFLTVNEKQRVLSAGEIGIINREEVHFGNPSPGGPCEADAVLVDIDSLLPASDISVKKELQALAASEVVLAPVLSREIPFYPEVAACLDRLVQIYGNFEIGSSFRALSLIYELLSYFFSADELSFSISGGVGQNREKIKRLNEVLRYIGENYSRKIYISELADRLYMGEDNFYKFFVSVTGTSPASYMNSFRMKRAAEFLTGTDLSVTDICYKAGFNNVSYFIKMFQKYYGQTPKRYRSLYLGRVAEKKEGKT